MSKSSKLASEAAGGVEDGQTFSQFLEAVPPGQTVDVVDLFHKESYPTGGYHFEISVPQLLLHCTEQSCNGLRFFRYFEGDRRISHEKTVLQTFLTFVCSNCRKSRKFYSLQATRQKAGIAGQCYKFGELPPYGPPTPARLIRLFGEERETFLKGRQCENHGLGVGAFAYYRRVVENQRNRILDEVIRVSEKIGVQPNIIKILQEAKKETQFSKALSSVKDALPQVLFVNGHNPLTLLHRALSEGLHQQSDEECLALAHDVRVVLVELAERLGQALKDDAELSSAVSRLMGSKPSSKS